VVTSLKCVTLCLKGIACWDFLHPLRRVRPSSTSRVEGMDMPATAPHKSITPDLFNPTIFTRYNLSLHALLLENQPWFCARDIGRLMGFHLSERIVNKLDKDQYRTVWI